MSIGLSVIALNERATLPGLLSSIEGAFDQVVLVDTGSTDGTPQLFRKWAGEEAARNPTFSSDVANFAWDDDFSRARNFADSRLTTEWAVWADADDEIKGAQQLRRLTVAAPPDVSAFSAGYRYAYNRMGDAIAYVKCIRVVRSGAGRWHGRVHEVLNVRGCVAEIPARATEWIHRRDFLEGRSAEAHERNLRLLHAWEAEEPDNPRVAAFLAETYAADDRHEQALDYYKRHIALHPAWGPMRARVHRQMAISLMALGRNHEALDLGHEAVTEGPPWAESYLTLAEAYLRLGEPLPAIEAARSVLRLGEPDTDLGTKPLDFSVRPRLLIATALRQAGRAEESALAAEEILADCFSN